jgi:PAS domain S-box-containing protein
MHALFGLMPSTFGGRYAQFLEMIHAEDRQQVAREFAQALESRAEYDGEFRVVWPNGSVRTLRARSKVCCDKQGKPVRMTGVTWDVSERSEMQSALARERFLLKTLMDNLPDPHLLQGQGEPLYCSKSRYGSVVRSRGSNARARQDRRRLVHSRARPGSAQR